MNKQMNDEELKRILQDLLDNVDEDCPSEYRTKHLRIAMDEAREALRGFYPPSPWSN